MERRRRFVENKNMERGDTPNSGTAKKATKGLKKKKWIANEWEILISMWAENECFFNISSLQHKFFGTKLLLFRV